MTREGMTVELSEERVSAGNNYRKYLIPSVAARLSNLELIAKLVVEGFMAGLHKSPYHGFSVEFAEHRQYMPGDDLKHLDWKVYARTNRYYIKQYEEETNLKSYILLDMSRSMAYSSELKKSDGKKSIFGQKKNTKETIPPDKQLTKLEYASYLAASLAYLMVLQRDAVSLTTYDTKIRKYIPPKSTNANLKLILKELSQIKPDDRTGTAASLNEIADKIKRRGLIIIISDFFDNQDEVISAFRHFRYDKNEVIVFQVLDPVEISFLKGNPVTLIDMETKEEMYSQPLSVQKAYTEAMSEFIHKYKTECRKNNIDYITLSTETPFDTGLLRYLNRRKKSL
ncbi:MAG: DUF58 domain-containing protein [Ignavibacteriae bacterium]|nr:DUF58 domain-containing protein [Ignavibacteriota bacterium]